MCACVCACVYGFVISLSFEKDMATPKDNVILSHTKHKLLGWRRESTNGSSYLGYTSSSENYTLMRPPTKSTQKLGIMIVDLKACHTRKAFSLQKRRWLSADMMAIFKYLNRYGAKRGTYTLVQYGFRGNTRSKRCKL